MPLSIAFRAAAGTSCGGRYRRCWSCMWMRSTSPCSTRRMRAPRSSRPSRGRMGSPPGRAWCTSIRTAARSPTTGICASRALRPDSCTPPGPLPRSWKPSSGPDIESHMPPSLIPIVPGRSVRVALLLLGAAALAACATLPSAGPSSAEIRSGTAVGIRVIDVDDAVTRRLAEGRVDRLFSEIFPGASPHGQIVRPGDVLEVSVWEAPPTVLFSSGIPLATASQGENGPASSSSPGGTSSNVTTLPQQMVDAAGTIYVPFAGVLSVAGKSLSEIEADITRQLQGKANKPQVLARLAANNTAYVTIVGEVTSSTRLPLTPRGERLLDALAAAGGTKGPVEKSTLQLTRGAAG